EAVHSLRKSVPTGRPMGSAIPCPLSTHVITATVPAIRAVEYPNTRPRVSHGPSRSSARHDCHRRPPLMNQLVGRLSGAFGHLAVSILPSFRSPERAKTPCDPDR